MDYRLTPCPAKGAGVWSPRGCGIFTVISLAHSPPPRGYSAMCLHLGNKRIPLTSSYPSIVLDWERSTDFPHFGLMFQLSLTTSKLRRGGTIVASRSSRDNRTKTLTSSVATVTHGWVWSCNDPAPETNCAFINPAPKHADVITCWATYDECAKPIGHVVLTGVSQSSGPSCDTSPSSKYPATVLIGSPSAVSSHTWT